MSKVFEKEMPFNDFVERYKHQGTNSTNELESYVDKAVDELFEQYLGTLEETDKELSFTDTDRALNNFKNYGRSPIYVNACLLKAIIDFDYTQIPYTGYNALASSYIIYALHNLNELTAVLKDGDSTTMFRMMHDLRIFFSNTAINDKSKTYLHSFLKYQIEQTKGHDLSYYYSDIHYEKEKAKKAEELWVLEVLEPLIASFKFEPHNVLNKYHNEYDQLSNYNHAHKIKPTMLEILYSFQEIVRDGAEYIEYDFDAVPAVPDSVYYSIYEVATELMQINPLALENMVFDLANNGKIKMYIKQGKDLTDNNAFLSVIHGLYLGDSTWRTY